MYQGILKKEGRHQKIRGLKLVSFHDEQFLSMHSMIVLQENINVKGNNIDFIN